MKIAIAQPNPTVGDLSGNRKKVEEAVARASDAGAELVVLPEMVLTGYPPMDLLSREGFVNDQMRELERLHTASRTIPILLGAVVRLDEQQPQPLANAAVLLAGGGTLAVRPKSLLPSYDVFDERRHFSPAKTRSPVALPGNGISLGLTVCEDAWGSDVPYDIDPVTELVREGADILFNLSASPWHVGKPRERREMLSRLARTHATPLVFVNQVGGNDELIFDGGSFAVDSRGEFLGGLAPFEPGFGVIEVPSGSGTTGKAVELTDLEAAHELETGLVLGIHDYFSKQNLPPNAVVGLSGGIDSAVTAHLAVMALGPEKVLGVAMPGPFSSEHSLSDALKLGRSLGIEIRTVDIRPLYEAYLSVFTDLFGERDDYGITQQNVQSRIRGNILMAISNQDQRLVLATGNKSELSLGYCTLYGDTVGGIAVLGDVYKRDVYALAHQANRDSERIPWNTIEKPPSAELAPDQVDANDLPPYDLVDAILEQAIEGQAGRQALSLPSGCSPETAQSILRRLDGNEYKRRQSPLVLRTSRKAFGSGRRLPIVHGFET